MAYFNIPNTATSIQFTKVLNDVGYGSFEITQKALAASDASSAQIGDIFNVVINGNIVFSFIWENTTKEYKNDVWTYTISGRGITAQLANLILWPNPNKNQLNSSVHPYQFIYQGQVYTIQTDEGVQGVYLRAETDPRNDLGSTVGEVLQTLINEAQFRNATVPEIVGAGQNDAAGNPWSSFLPTSFNFRIGQTYLEILQKFVSAGLCIFRQIGSSIYVYRPDHQFQKIDYSAYKYKVTGVTIKEDSTATGLKNILVLDKDIVTSYRPGTTAGTKEKAIAVEISQNPNVHACLAANEINKSAKQVATLNTFYTPWGISPLIDFDVGDYITYITTDINISEQPVQSITATFDNNLKYVPVSLEIGNCAERSVEEVHEAAINDLKLKTQGSLIGNADINYGIFPLASTITVNFGNSYVNKPIVTVSLQADPGVTIPQGLIVTSQLTQDANRQYNGVIISVQGSFSDSTGVYVAVHAICFN
jgi:hypothetical protein